MLKKIIPLILIMTPMIISLFFIASMDMEIYSDEKIWSPTKDLPKIRLYFIETGKLRIDYDLMEENTRIGKKVWIPIQSSLIIHPKGKVLFDTGMHPMIATDPEKRLGKGCFRIGPSSLGYRMDYGQDIVSQLKKLGYSTNDIDYVVNSHLHFDHAGCNEFFSQSTFLIQKRELQHAYSQEQNDFAYCRSDFDLPFNFHVVKGDYDIFGDKTVIILYTPGHTPGHQSLLVKLQSGPVILAADACYVAHNFLDLKLPRALVNADDEMKSVMRIKRYKDNWTAMVTPGHDPEFWSQIRKAPDFYE